MSTLTTPTALIPPSRQHQQLPDPAACCSTSAASSSAAHSFSRRRSMLQHAAHASAHLAPPAPDLSVRLPAELCLLLCAHLGWKDLVALEQSSSGWRGALASEPLIWVTQMLKQYPKHMIPKSVMAHMSAPPAPATATDAPLSWRDIFVGMRRVQPALAAVQRPLLGFGQIVNNATLVAQKGSDYQQVLRVYRRASFVSRFESLPAGRYTVMLRVKVTPGRRVYVNFTSHFSRPGAGGSAGLDSMGHMVTNPLGTAGPVAAADAEGEVEEEGADWPPAGQAVAAAAALEGLAAAAAGSAADGAEQQRQVLEQLAANRRGWRRWRPDFQLLMGSCSASWHQISRLPSSDMPVLDAIQSSRAALGRAAASPAAVVPEVSSATSSSRGLSESEGWLTVPVGTVTLHTACCVRLTFVALGTSMPRSTNPAAPDQGSMHLDYVALQPAPPSSALGLFRLRREVVLPLAPVAACFGAHVVGGGLRAEGAVAGGSSGSRQGLTAAGAAGGEGAGRQRLRSGMKSAAAVGNEMARALARALSSTRRPRAYAENGAGAGI